MGFLWFYLYFSFKAEQCSEGHFRWEKSCYGIDRWPQIRSLLQCTIQCVRMYVPVYISSAIHSVTSSSSERATPNSQSYDQNGFSVCCNKEISQIIKRTVPEIHEEGDEIRFRSFHRKSYICLTWIYRWNRWKRFLYLMRNLKHIGDLYERQTRKTYLH